MGGKAQIYCMSYDHPAEAVFYTITVVVGVVFFRLWGIHMLCISGDGGLPKFRP
jgi:hypothetical protein